MKRTAFTLAEILMALIIVAIVSGAVISSLNGLTNNTNKPAFQKCYTHMTNTINDMLNDKMVYPDIPTSETDLSPQGFDNDFLENGSQSSFKFVDQFMNRTLGAVQYSSDTDYKDFVAQDKSYWQISTTKTDSKKKKYHQIYIDVNGLDKGSNCPGVLKSDETEASSCTDPDRYYFYIYGDGSIQIVDMAGKYNGKNQNDFLSNNNYFGFSAK